MKRFPLILAVVLFLLPIAVFGQGTYYNSIDTSSSTFVTDLYNLIKNHTQVSYDNFKTTNIVFVSRDTTGGQKVVTCVYSGQNYVYTAPFSWIPFSREHTWCHSWMPTYSSTSGKEYSDQHHLFPTNQDNANGRRSNHPLGTVTSVSYQYLEGKLGTNSSGQTVYEPRASHKGDAARALFYMAVRYHNENGNDWSFYALNTRLAALASPEAPQSVDLLVQWHNDDPPDQWEKDRNAYIYSIQGNRNPFIDHPEYVNVINFSTMTKKSTSSGTEPTNYPSGYTMSSVTASAATISWSDPSGSVLPTGYLVKISTTNSFTAPTNGTVYSDQTTLSGGSGQVNVAYGTGQYTFSGLSASTTYYFRIYPYNGNSTSRYYKTASYPSALEGTFTTSSVSDGKYISITSLTYSYSQSFNTLSSSGTSNTWTDTVTLTGWYSTRTSYAAATGNSTTGALYSFGSDAVTERSLGSVASGSTGTIYYAVRFKNTSGSTITSIPIQYVGKQWRNGGTTTQQKLTFEYRINASSISDAGTWTAVPALDFTGPIATATATSLDGNATANKTTVSSTLSLTLLNGDEIWFRWTDVNDADSDHGLAVDQFSLNSAGSAMPVELVSFQALVSGSTVTLQWKTATETNNASFEIERMFNGANARWESAGHVAGSGTVNTPREYSFVDKGLPAGRYTYRLKQIDTDGSVEYLTVADAVVTNNLPAILRIRNYPNPFNPSTTIGFTLRRSGITRVTVFDAIGREIATLVDEYLEKGIDHRRSFVVPDHSASGVYFVRITNNGETQLHRMLFMK